MEFSDFEEEQPAIPWVEEWLDRLAEESSARIAGRPAGWFVGPTGLPPPALVFKDGVLTVHPHAKNTVVPKVFHDLNVQCAVCE